MQNGMSALPPIATAKADISSGSCPLYPQKRTCAVHLGMSALGHKRTFQRCRYSSFVDGFYQREFGLVQWARYAIAAIEPGLLPTINASSSFTRYRKGVSAVVSPDFFLPLTWPQMTSKG